MTSLRVATHDVFELGIDELRPGRYQPRLQLREEGLAELAESIREQGVLQPLIVRAMPAAGENSASQTYEIVAGERRWRAARLAGLTTVPVSVRELTDQAALAVALIENLQREDLNPIDQAQSMARLIEEFDLTHDEIAHIVDLGFRVELTDTEANGAVRQLLVDAERS